MKTKTCSKCGENKPIEDFAFKNKKRGLRQAHCRECQAAYRRVHYLENREKYIKKARRWNGKQKEVLRAIWYNHLLANPCVDCGETDPIVLDLDHVRGEKDRCIADMVQHCVSVETFEAEIAKCETRCASCHRKRHAYSDGHWMLDFKGR